MTSVYQVGGADVEVRIALAIPPSRALNHLSWKRLQDEYPEFSGAVEAGHLLAEAWMYQKAREGA